MSSDYEKHPLTQIADYAISESGLFAVQDYIRELLLPFEPSASHKVLPSFRWRAIVTTNYDQLIEKAYSSHASPVQRLIPLFSNTDHWDDVIRDPDCVPLLKLHGCISRTHDEACPLILSMNNTSPTVWGEADYSVSSRNSLLNVPSFTSGSATPIRHSLAYSSIGCREGRSSSLLLISPSVDSIAQRYWSSRQITALSGTLEQAVSALDSTISPVFRGLRKSPPIGVHAISDRFASSKSFISTATRSHLSLTLSTSRQQCQMQPAMLLSSIVESASHGRPFRTRLMSGVGFMIPFLLTTSLTIILTNFDS